MFFSKSKKLISMLMIFVIVFSYMGQTLEAIATTDGIAAVTNGFLKNGEMKFNSYFGEEGNTQNISDVNEKAMITFEIAPNDIGKGFLKEGSITADSDSNFKFSEIKNIIVDEMEEKAESIETNSGVEENDSLSEKNVTENSIISNNTVENAISEDETFQENIVNETENIEHVMIDEVIENTVRDEVTSRSSEPRTAEADENGLINEEEVIQNKMEESYEELTAKDFEIEIINDNDIKVQNVIYNTKVEVEIEYNKKDILNISDLFREINLQLRGTYINLNLERIEIEENQDIIVGWKYNKEFELSAEYTQVSPFRLGEHTGTIVESKINIKRESEEKNYLPIKQTTLEINVPDYNGNLPETVTVQATKLMATKGEELGEVVFNQDNWHYDKENKKIWITVTNEKDGTAVNSIGEDEYIILYRYQDYMEQNVNIEQNVKATIEEYSSNEPVTTKEIHNTQEIQTKENDLINYNLGTTTEKLNKAKINANYNSQEAIYETEFVTTVNINILTSDLLEEFKINASKELYLDSNATEFDATEDIYYNKVTFNYAEIKNLLQNGASVEIQSLEGNLLYTLTNDSIQSEDDCEIRLASQEKGLYVVFKNVSVNGNVSVEFTKAIKKSNYDKATFNGFKQINSFVSAELKYKNFDEIYQMAEISTTKELEDSKTIAELNLTNNNLATVAKNDNVELRIVLNNDKQDTDLYINPSFELVFPKYVKNVTVENINLMYGNGLRIEDFQTYTENENIKMRIQLSGIQTTFCESLITNGTNILLNLDIELEEYTPKKQDQIKLYYCNEGVSNYESQTKWSISKAVPSGILKDTNGFDAAIINYKAPNGFVTANTIINYDGKSSKITSISQGERTAQMSINQNAQIATMELVAMNNTENQCTDGVFIGRIPFKNNKSVITGKSLGTTTNVKLLNGLQESIQNPNMTTIYYSNNENATRDLNNAENGWNTNVTNWQEIKSYMIVVKGEIAPGTILKYTYDFEIPGELYYDESVFGSFGGYYNNHYEHVVSYESTEADKVGVITESKPNIKDIDNQSGLNMAVYPYGENENLYYGQIVTLVTKVVNNTEEDILNSTLHVTVPTGTVFTEQNEAGSYLDNAGLTMKEFAVENLKVGETRDFKFEVRVLESQQDKTILAGYANLNDVTQNYQLRARKGKLSVNANVVSENAMYYEGSELRYLINIHKETEDILNDLQMSFDLPDFIQVNEVKLYDDEGVYKDVTYKDLKYNVEGETTTVEIGNIERDRKIEVVCKVSGLNVGNSNIDAVFDVYESAQKNKKYTSNPVRIKTEKANVQVSQSISANEFNYHDEFEYRILIQNQSNMNGYISIDNELPNNIYLRQTKMIINGEEKEIESFNTFSKYEELSSNGTIEIVATGEIMDWGNLNEDLNLSNIVKVTLPTGEELQSNEINVIVHKTPEEEEEIEELEESTEQAVEEIDYEDSEEEVEEEVETYSISGNVYVDADANGVKTEEDRNVKSQVQVQLLKGSTMIRATTTDSEGNYAFSNLKNGDYSVVYHYDKENYTPTKYTQGETHETSKAIETEEGISVTDNINITNNSIENINTGLLEKDKFDFAIKQYIESAIVNVKGEETTYDYDDLELAKIEINPSDLKNATVKLKYKIVVTNVGNVEGQVTSIVDYLPNGLIFDQAENEGWTIGVIKENVYYDGLKGIHIAPGESKEISLILNKKMTEENTGIVSNKVQIAYTESDTRLTESIEGNFATQETIITVTQGAKTGLKIVVTTVSFAGVIALFGYMIKTGKLEKKFNGRKLIKRIYK